MEESGPHKGKLRGKTGEARGVIRAVLRVRCTKSVSPASTHAG
jgi:hypothetical protein